MERLPESESAARRSTAPSEEGAEVREGAVEVLRVTHARARPSSSATTSTSWSRLPRTTSTASGRRMRARTACVTAAEESSGRTMKRERASVELSDTGDA